MTIIIHIIIIFLKKRDSKFDQSDDLKYKIIPSYEIEVEETIVKPPEDEPIASEVWVSDYQQKQNSSL